eukprot:jgi/Orpsp1_1/1180668/evm.model.c7180000074263.1
MLFKSLLKVINFSLLASLALANDCDDIKNYLNERKIVYNDNIDECVCNKQGKLDTIKISSKSIEEKDINKILSYDTIRELHYYCGVFSNGDDDIHFSVYEQFPKAITKLPNLEILDLSYGGYREYARGEIEKGVLKVSNTLKSLTLSRMELSDDNINEISNLSNLETLDISGGNRESPDNNFDSFKKLSKLTKLTISRFHHFELEEIPDFVFSLNNLKS